MEKDNPTLQDVLDAVNEAATATENRFSLIENRLSSIDTKVTTTESRVTKIEANMVTKDYLDVKLVDMKGDLILLMRKEDTKVRALVELLQKKKLITSVDAKGILALDPFPQSI